MTTDQLDTLPAAHSDNGTIRLVLLRLDGLTAGMGEVKAFMQNLDARLRQLELERVGAQATQEAKITSAHNRLDVLADKVKENTSDIHTLGDSQRRTDAALARYADGWRVLTWVASAVGLAIIGLIVAVVTGQVQLVFTG